MILNAYAVLDAFVCLLRLGIGVLVVGLGVCALWTWFQRTGTTDDRKVLEDRGYLLYLLGGLLLALNVISWPIFYLLLLSYVPEWGSQVMCMYGVTQIGTNSIDSSRFLPALVTTLQTTKPALIFLSGAWFVLYLINRATRTAPLTGRVLVVLLAAGALAVGDAAAEGAYLVIPKKEVTYDGGCCTMVFDEDTRLTRLLPQQLFGDNARSSLFCLYFGVNVAVIVLVFICWFGGTRFGWLGSKTFVWGALPLLVLAALATLAVDVTFLVEAAAPALLHKKDHHCPYCLVPKAPGAMVAVALFIAGSFFVGWTAVAGWLGRRLEAIPLLPGVMGRFLYNSCLCYLGSLIMMSLELYLA